MDRQLIFQQFFFDLKKVNGNGVYSFFEDYDQDDNSITNLHEEEAIKWLFEYSSFQELFIGNILPNSKNPIGYFGVSHPVTLPGRKPGDIDILLFDEFNPHLATAIECKRVKVTVDKNAKPKVNNVGKISKAFKQARAMRDMGFYKSYVCIILLEDNRELKSANTFIRSSKLIELQEVYSIPQNESLHEDVGVIYIRITQNTRKLYSLNSGVGFCIDKEAKPLVQSIPLTNKIKECRHHYKNIVGV